MDDLTRDALEVIAPDAIINAAGKTDLAWCEANAREAIRSNLEAPVRLYQRILKLEKSIRFIHFSSGCVWDGPYDPDGMPFTPDSPPTPACLYSWTKAAADAMLLALNSERIAILRPRQVYSGKEYPLQLAHQVTAVSKVDRYSKLREQYRCDREDDDTRTKSRKQLERYLEYLRSWRHYAACYWRDAVEGWASRAAIPNLERRTRCVP